MHRTIWIGSFALVMALAACAPSQSGGSVPAAPQVEQKATVALSQILDSLDPGALAVTARRYEIFDTLVLRDDKGEFAPALATSWTVVNPTTWRFTLRTDVPFHDGSMLTADDVKYSFDRILDPSNKLAYLTRISNLAGVDVPDRSTVLIRSKGPDPVLLGRMAQVGIVSKAYVERLGMVEFAAKPIGTGPYKVVSWSPENQLQLAASDTNPFRKATLRELTLKRVTETATRIAGLQTGDVHYIDAVPFDRSERLKADGYGVVSGVTGSSLGFFMGSHFGDQPMNGPTADKRVRQAINYAIDKESIVKVIYGGLVPPEGQFVQDITFGYNPNVKAYPFNQARAKQLLGEAGYPSGFTLLAEAPGYVAEFQTVGLMMQQNLRDIGVTLEFKLHADVSAQSDKVFGRTARPPLLGIRLGNAPLYDASVPLTYYWSKFASGPRMYSNPAFDRLFEAQEIELDQAKRQGQLRELIAIVHEDPGFLWLAPVVAITAFDAKKIEVDKRWVAGETRYDLAFKRIA